MLDRLITDIFTNSVRLQTQKLQTVTPAPPGQPQLFPTTVLLSFRTVWSPAAVPMAVPMTDKQRGTFALLPHSWISLLIKIVWPSNLHTTYLSGNSTRWYNFFFFFSNRKSFFSNLKSPKFTPTLLLCVLAVNGRPGYDPFMSRYVCHRWNVRRAHFLCLSGSLRSVFLPILLL